MTAQQRSRAESASTWKIATDRPLPGTRWRHRRDRTLVGLGGFTRSSSSHCVRSDRLGASDVGAGVVVTPMIPGIGILRRKLGILGSGSAERQPLAIPGRPIKRRRLGVAGLAARHPRRGHRPASGLFYRAGDTLGHPQVPERAGNAPFFGANHGCRVALPTADTPAEFMGGDDQKNLSCPPQ
jgi:hypothetical protein